MSVDRGEYFYCGKLSEALANGEATFLPYLIAKPRYKQPDRPLDCRVTRELDDERRESSLSYLPPELLLRVFEYADICSALSLSLTSTRTWSVGWLYVRAQIIDHMGPWRGTRILCEGDENLPTYLPAGMLSPVEIGILMEGLDEDELDEEDGYRSGPLSLNKLMRARGDEVDGHFNIPMAWRTLFFRPSCSLPESQRHEALRLIDEDRRNDLFAPNDDWTLRNISAKKFVLGRKLNAAFHPRQRSTGLDLPYPGFAEALLSQISWSKSKSSSMDVNKGDWAGQRFEILTDADHRLASDARWTDESEKTISILAEVLGLESFPVDSTGHGMSSPTANKQKREESGQA